MSRLSPFVARAISAAVERLEGRRLLSGVNVTTYHYDNARDGANTAETTLTPANVNSGTFGKVASLPVDGQVYAQPLVMTGVAVPGQGTHDIVLVATEADDVYAFDAAGNNPAQGYLWRTSLLQSGETTIPEADYGTTDITPQIGITGTPVIDPATNTLYVVGAFKESNATYAQRIYALDLSTGAAKFGGPVTIVASVAGTGDGASGGQVAFNAFKENQRPALTLANGQVYVGWASHGDQGPYHGWVIAYNSATLQRDYVYNVNPNGSASGIWMSGGGLAVDASGNLYFTTGNGTFDANTGGSDYGMSMEKLSPSLSVLDYFTPSNEATLSNSDLDYGCSDVVLLTGQSGGVANQVLSEGKWGTLYLNPSDTGSMGEFTAGGPNDDLSEANISASTTSSVMHNTMAYWNGHVYVGGDALTAMAFAVGGGAIGSTPSSKTAHVFGSASDEDGQGTGPTVSANGNANGIVWAVDNTGYTANPAVLYAYDASNLGTLLYSSSQAANGRDTAGGAVKFQTAVVANGFVYVAGANSVSVYGLLNPSTARPTLTAAASATPSPATGTTTTLAVSASDPAADLRPVYTWAATTVPSGAATPAFSVNGTNSANAPTVTFYRAGSYTFTCTITDPNSQLTTTSSVAVTVTQTPSGLTASPSAVTVPDHGSQQFTATTVDQFGNAMAAQPTVTWAVNAGGAGGTITAAGLYTAPASGTGTDTVTATSGSYTATVAVTVAVPSPTVQVDLTTSFNKVGIVPDGTTFTTGIDTTGAALSGTLLGTTKTIASSSYTFGPTSTSNAVANVVYGTGQAIPLAPQGRYATLKFLGLHINGSATDLPFVVTYTDGTTQSLTQSVSDWYSPQTYAGETKAVTMAYRDLSTGAKDRRTFYVYGYSIALDPTKTVQSLTLPADTNFDLLSIDLLGVAVTVPAAANPTAVTGTTTALSVTATDPTGDASPTYTWAATTVPAGAAAPTFSANGTTAAASTTATFAAAGNYTFTVTATDPTSGASATSSVAVTVAQSVKTLAVTPSGTVTLADGRTQQFTAAATDQFGAAFASAPAVSWSVASGVGSITSTGLYTAPATGTGSAVVQAAANGHTATANVLVTLPAWLGSGSAATWNATTHVLTVTGAASIVADPGSDLPLVQAAGSSAALTINPAGNGTQVHLGGLTLTTGATATLTSLGTARSATNHRVLVVGTAGQSGSPPLSIDAASQLNLTDGDLVDHAGSLAGVSALVGSGFANGRWTGKGIASTVAGAAKSIYALGVGQPFAAGTVDAEPVTTADVLVRYTYYGDLNLDGSVNAADYTRIDAGFVNGRTGWANGDLNYDGTVDGSDYTLMDDAFNMQAATPAAIVAAPAVVSVAKPAAVAARPSVPASTQPVGSQWWTSIDSSRKDRKAGPGGSSADPSPVV